ncbi:MAG: hypothetical protein HRT88_16875 [Lentisphaeraceae bacterium]|nr:hypothetical protein [Lentisphaeraceae bacterium]
MFISASQGIHWHLHIGDPSFVGWLITFAYFTAFIQSIYYLKKAKLFNEESRLPALFWSATSVIVLLLGINKQLDLHNLLMDIGRIIAKEQGWYSLRQKYQVIFIIGLIGIVLTLAALAIAYLRPLIKRYFSAFCGLGLVSFFVIVRASSFQHMDKYMASRLINSGMNWIFELCGVSLIFMSALRSLNRKEEV